MYRVAHIFLGLSAGLLLCGSKPYSIICGVASAFGSYIVDLGHRTPHRPRITHNYVLPAILYLLVYSTSQILYSTWKNPYSGFLVEILSWTLYSLLLGWVLHVFADSITSYGVWPLYPIIKKRVRGFKRLRSSSLIGNLVLLMVSAMLIHVWMTSSLKTSDLNFYLEKIWRILSSLLT